MKVVVAANPDSTHTRKWVLALHTRGIEVVLFSLTAFDVSYYQQFLGIRWYGLEESSTLVKQETGFRKLSYLKGIGRLKNVLKVEKPDLLHAHYASSYGFVAALSGYHPYIVSVWGSDVFQFPRGSWIARKMLKYTFRKADNILSTSKVMADETRIYTAKSVAVTPFGIDTSIMVNDHSRLYFTTDDVVIGSIKTLEQVYGHELLLAAFAELKVHCDKSVKLLIVGDGSLRSMLEAKAVSLGIAEDTVFTGFVEHERIVSYFSSIDIFAITSLQESFGVAAIEASSCGLPVVATEVGGLPEVVQNSITGMLVESGNIAAFAEALKSLVENPELRSRMGEAGRNFVKENYEWNVCVDKMLEIYRTVTKN